jgi:hypothetical protein
VAIFWLLLSWNGALETAGPGITWKPQTRDVYVNGELKTSAEFLQEQNGKRYALVLEGHGSAWVLEPKDESLVWRSAVSTAFKLADDGLSYQSSEALKTNPGGSVTEIGERQYFWQSDRLAIVVGRHQGVTGPLTQERLFEVVPYWKRLYEAYQPNEQSVRDLAAMREETQLHITLGTWCGDSRREVPRMLKVLDLADNPKLTVKMTALSRGFEEPWDVIVDGKITNVPTVRAIRSGREVAKVVERPRIKAIETELAFLLSGKLPDQSMLTQEVVLAEGSFTHKNDRGELTAHEHWRVVRPDRGGFRLHSQVRDGVLASDYRLDVNEEGRPVYLQVTETSDDSHQRTRYSFGETRIRGTRRGHATGIVRQHLGFKHGLLLETKSALVNGWCVARHQGDWASVFDLAEGMGAVKNRRLSEGDCTDWQGAVGHLRARKRGWANATWWVHETLRIPLRQIGPEGMVELDTLVLHSAAALKPAFAKASAGKPAL